MLQINKHIVIYYDNHGDDYDDTPLTDAVLNETRWLYCVECPQYSIRLEALGYI